MQPLVLHPQLVNHLVHQVWLVANGIHQLLGIGSQDKNNQNAQNETAHNVIDALACRFENDSAWDKTAWAKTGAKIADLGLQKTVPIPSLVMAFGFETALPGLEATVSISEMDFRSQKGCFRTQNERFRSLNGRFGSQSIRFWKTFQKERLKKNVDKTYFLKNVSSL